MKYMKSMKSMKLFFVFVFLFLSFPRSLSSTRSGSGNDTGGGRVFSPHISICVYLCSSVVPLLRSNFHSRGDRATFFRFFRSLTIIASTSATATNRFDGIGCPTSTAAYNDRARAGLSTIGTPFSRAMLLIF